MTVQTTPSRDRGLSPRRPSPVGARTPTGIAKEFADAVKDVAGGRLAQLPLSVRFWDGSMLEAPDSPAIAVVRSPRVLAHLLHEPGELGLTRAWVDGSLGLEGELESILPLRQHMRGIHIARGERARLAVAAARLAGPQILLRPPIPAIEARPRGRRHSVARDRVAVRHHYELSNRFYRMLLGPSLVYSCAYFESPADSLEAAQERKLELICRKLRLAPGERLLDVGCGWGSLLIHAAQHHGARGVGVTLSDAQAQLARERIAEAGLTDRVQVRVCDYRELTDGPFDKIASVGMYEHVGRSELADYVTRVRGLLRPGGLFLNHGIARLRAAPESRKTFIARYIFPDGELHPVTDVMVAMQEAGFELRDVEGMREHYVMTLRRWAANLDANQDAARREVGDERMRVWRLYLLGSAHAFAEGEIGVFQVLGARDGAPHNLPLARAELIAA